MDRTLTELQRRYRCASHEVARTHDPLTPADCPEHVVVWWRAAYAELQRRSWQLDARNPYVQDVTGMERRKDRLRKPSH